MESKESPIFDNDNSEELKRETVECTKGILWKRGRWGIFRKPWVERMFILNDQKQTLSIYGGREVFHISLLGAVCRECAPSDKDCGGKSNCFEIKYRKSNYEDEDDVKQLDNDTDAESQYSTIVMRSRFAGERDLWVAALNAASDGSKLKLVRCQKRLEITRKNAIEMLNSGNNIEAVTRLEQALALTERQFGNGSLELAQSTIDVVEIHYKLIRNYDNIDVIPLVQIDESHLNKLIHLCDNALSIYRNLDVKEKVHTTDVLKCRLLFLQGNYNDAVTSLKQILKGFHKQPEKHKSDIVEVLILMGRCAYGACNLSNAANIFEQALSLALALFGTVHAQVAKICTLCASTCMTQRKFLRVREYLDITSRIYSKIYTSSSSPLPQNVPSSTATTATSTSSIASNTHDFHDDYILSQRLLGHLSLEVGAFEGAQKFLKLVESSTYDSHDNKINPQYAISCDLIARLHFEQNDYDSALVYCQKAHDSLTACGLDTSNVMYLQALIFSRCDPPRIEDAIRLFKDSIKKETPTIEYCRRVFRVGSIFINMTGNHSNSNHLLPNNQGDMNQVNDKIYRKGISMLQKSLNLFEKFDLESVSDDVEEVQRLLAECTDDLNESNLLYLKVLENHTQHHGKDKTFAELSRKHGMILSELQEIPAALKSLEASIESYIKIDNPEDDESIVEHYDYYLTVISLSMVYRKAGDYASAYLFLSAINKMNDLPLHARVTYEIALTTYEKGDYKKAGKEFLECINILKSKKRKFPYYNTQLEINCHVMIGNVMLKKGKREKKRKALNNFRIAADILQKRNNEMKEDNPSTNNLAHDPIMTIELLQFNRTKIQSKIDYVQSKMYFTRRKKTA